MMKYIVGSLQLLLRDLEMTAKTPCGFIAYVENPSTLEVLLDYAFGLEKAEKEERNRRSWRREKVDNE